MPYRTPHLKHTGQGILLYPWSCTSSTTINLRTFSEEPASLSPFSVQLLISAKVMIAEEGDCEACLGASPTPHGEHLHLPRKKPQTILSHSPSHTALSHRQLLPAFCLSICLPGTPPDLGAYGARPPASGCSHCASRSQAHAHRGTVSTSLLTQPNTCTA